MKRARSSLVLVMLAVILATGLTALFWGCGGGGGSDDPPVIAEKDNDSDGVRDDIEDYINKSSASTEGKEALFQYAKSLQDAYSNATTEDEARSAEQEIIKNLAKVKASGENSALNAPSRVIEDKTSNSIERLKQKLRYRDLLKGKVFYMTLGGNNVSSAQASKGFSSSCSPSSYLVMHINGILTDEEDARHNLMDVLAPAIGSSYNGEGIKFALAYNPTHGKSSDLIDVINQKATEYPNVALGIIIKAYTKGLAGMTSAVLPDSLFNAVKDFQISLVKDNGFVTLGDSDLKDVVGDIRKNMTENQKILLVPHSQGNIYANEVYNVLTTGENPVPQISIGIVGIASPAAYVAGNGDYVTSSNDVVIGALRLSGYSVLPSNIDISYNSNERLGHGFEEIYMNPDLQGKTEIVKKIHAKMGSLVSPGGEGSQGPITVTLTWGAQPDVDLHILEPDGTHVYYGSKTGNVGFLDVDDVSSYGPEHYYTSCSSLQTGTYTIGVNFFYGNAPETASVTISTPFSSITREVYLPLAVGYAGNSRPVEVGTIEVTVDEDGAYDFYIH